MARARPDRRAQLTQAALDVFTTRGYATSTVADIVAVAGMGHGSFYNYFSNKREILDAAMDLALETWIPYLSPTEELAENLDEFLDAMIAPWRTLHSVAVTDNSLVSLIVLEAGAVDERLTQRVIEIIETFAHSVQRHIDHGIEVGFLRPGLDTEVLSEVMVCAALVTQVPVQGGAPLPGGLDHVIAQVRELLRAGLGA